MSSRLIARARAAGLALLAVAALAAPEALGAQALEAKRSLPTSSGGCNPPPAGEASPADVARARALLGEAQQAVLEGDRTGALTRLAEAARLSPGDADVAYHRGRLLEENGEAAPAFEEFCRFLALAPTSPDADDVRDRLAALPRPAAPAVPPAVEAQFRNGVIYLDRGSFGDAARAFTYALHHQPGLAEARFNRAVAYLGLGRRHLAAQDLEAYLALVPSAPDREAVLAHLRAPAPARREGPGSGVLVGSLFVPGLGQFATRRPVLGAAAAVGVGAAVGMAFQSREVERTATFLDPFGNAWPYTVRAEEHPYRVGGIAAAGAITLLAAAEAYLYNRRAPGTTAAAPPLLPLVEAGADGSVAAGFSLTLPATRR